DAFATAQTTDNLLFFAAQFRRNDKGDRLANGFLRRETEDLLRAGIPSVDDAVEIFGDDAVVGGFDDGGQPPVGVLGSLSFSDVVKEIHNANNRAVAVSNRINVHRNRNAASVRLFDDDILFVHRDARL